MRLATTLLSLALVQFGGACIAADAEVRVTRHGASTVSHDQALLGDVIALLESCTVDSTSYAVKADTWRNTLQADSAVHVRFAPPRKLNLKASSNQGREPRAVDEILVPLPKYKAPAHILVRNESGVHSFTKYGPRELDRLLKNLDAPR